MPSTNTSGLATLEDLTASAIKRRDAARWQLRGHAHTRYYLRMTGFDKYSRHVPEINLAPEVGAALSAAWKKNEYGDCIGAKTLPAIVKILGGPDVRPQIKEAEASAKAAEAARMQRQIERDVATAARALLDAMAKDTTRAAGGSIERGVHDLLDVITHKDSGAAQLVAYEGIFQNPRGDD